MEGRFFSGVSWRLFCAGKSPFSDNVSLLCKRMLLLVRAVQAGLQVMPEVPFLVVSAPVSVPRSAVPSRASPPRSQPSSGEGRWEELQEE